MVIGRRLGREEVEGEEGGAETPGLITQIRPRQGRQAVERAPLLEGFPERVEQDRPRLGQPTADHDEFGVVQSDSNEQPRGERADRLGPDGDGVRLPGDDVAHDQLRRRDGGGGSPGGGSPGGVGPGDRRCRRVRLEAAARTAAALGRVGSGAYDNVADLAGGSVGTGVDATVNDVATGDAGADRDEEHPPGRTAGSEARLGEGAGAHVVAERGGQSEPPGHEVPQRNAAEAQVGRPFGDAGGLVDDTGHDDTGGDGPEALVAGVLGEPGGRVEDRGEHGVGATVTAGVVPLGAAYRAGRIDQGTFDPRAADVEGDRYRVVRMILSRGHSRT